MADIHIVSFSSPYKESIIQIRDTVFTIEQGIDAEEDLDGFDESAWHALVIVDTRPVATGRMLNDGHIGRVAVLKPYRGLGLGAKIIHALIEQARKQQFKRVYLSSQVQAVGFYTKLGFSLCGAEYDEVGIIHQGMEMALTSPDLTD